jgi:uncharacterized SAM-binding protein YcdF (DUF218 family)
MIMLLVLSHDVWLPLPGRFLVVADPWKPADALVPLAGEPQRLTYGAELYRKSADSWFVTTDMYVKGWQWPFSYADWARDIAIEAGVPAERIVTPPGQPATTYDEAIGIRQLALSRGWHTLLVVTSPPHTRRTRLIFTDVFRNTGITIVVQPVANHPYSPTSWWTTQGNRHDTWLEYVKIGLYLVGYR